VTVVFAEQQIGRLQIAAILWSDGDEPRVRHRLRQLLHQTNSKLGACIRSDADDLRAWDAFPCDVAHFRRALTEGRLRDAATLLSTGFAPSRPRAVGRRFEEWAEEFERSLRRTLRTKAAGVWSEATHEGRWDAAQDAAEALYLAEPRNEEAVSKVMEARARLGRIGAAEAAYAAYVETLGPDSSPEPRLVEQMRRVTTLRATEKPGGRTPPNPFVGRTQALSEGRAVLNRVAAGRFSFLLVSGESGIGKTRFLEELQREAVLQDFRCLHASPVELERRIPLNPLLDAVSTLDLRPHLEALGKPWSSVIVAMLPAQAYGEWVEELPPIQEMSLPRRLLDAFALLLERLAIQRPTMLVVDDLHWADATTVAALQFFQRRWTTGSFGIIASVRTDLLDMDHPARTYLATDGDLEIAHIELGELSEGDAIELVEKITAGRPHVPILRLCSLAGLHPLYLTELTREYMAGHLTLPDVAAGQVTIPLSLRQILLARISQLSERALRVAWLLAVGARPISLVDLAGLLRMALDECADAVDELHSGRLVDVRDGTVRISHDLFRSALYSHMSDARRSVLHKTFAEHLLRETPGQRQPSAELAIHFARAGERGLAAHHGLVAAAGALESGAVAEAAYFFELVTENESDADTKADATEGLARALHLNRDISRANPLLELAAARLRERGWHERARRLEVSRVEGLAAVAAVPVAELIGRLDVIKVEARQHEDWEAVALAQDTELRLRHRQGDVVAIRRIFDDMRHTVRHGETDAVVLCHAGLAMQALFGNAAEGLASARIAAALATDSEYRLTALGRLLVVLQYQGMLFLPEATGTFHEARALAQRSGDLRVRFSLEGNLALGLLDAGELEQAEDVIEQANQLLGSADLDIPRFGQPNNRAELAWARGDFASAAEWYSIAERNIGPNTPTYARELVTAGLGLCALETGNMSEARRRESQLSDPPISWFYDPTTILAFRARLLELRGDRRAAITMLCHHAADVTERLVFAWLKVTVLTVRLLIKDRQYAAARERAEEGAWRATTLNLPTRMVELSQLAARATELEPQ
jgi:DNA-binding SARP family transcriptional activator/tetratricopeptide (TPR) repeat protein